MNLIRSLILYFIAGLTFLFFGPIVLLIIILYPKGAYKLIITWCKFMVVTFDCEINAKGKVPENETFVIMANHVSFLDVFAIPSVFTGKFSAVAASKNFNIPIYALFLKKLRVISIDRSNRQQSIKGIQQAELLLKEGYHIVILPEGTRTHDGSLGAFKKGGFHLAVNTGASILPIITKGLFKIKPIRRWSIKPGLIRIEVGKPISSHNKSIEELLNETEVVFNNMLKD